MFAYLQLFMIVRFGRFFFAVLGSFHADVVLSLVADGCVDSFSKYYFYLTLHFCGCKQRQSEDKAACLLADGVVAFCFHPCR